MLRCDECGVEILTGHLCARCRAREDGPYEPLSNDGYAELVAAHGYADDGAEF